MCSLAHCHDNLELSFQVPEGLRRGSGACLLREVHPKQAATTTLGTSSLRREAAGSLLADAPASASASVSSVGTWRGPSSVMACIIGPLLFTAWPAYSRQSVWLGPWDEAGGDHVTLLVLRATSLVFLSGLFHQGCRHLGMEKWTQRWGSFSPFWDCPCDKIKITGLMRTFVMARIPVMSVTDALQGRAHFQPPEQKNMRR